MTELNSKDQSFTLLAKGSTGEISHHIERSEVVTASADSEVRMAWIGQRKVAIKIFANSNSCLREELYLKAAASCGVPVANLLCSGKGLGKNCLVFDWIAHEFCSADTLESISSMDQLASHLSTCVAQLHDSTRTTTSSRFVLPPVACVSPDQWPNFFVSKVSGYLQSLEIDQKSSSFVNCSQLYELFYTQKGLLRPVSLSIVHGDFSCRNVRYNQADKPHIIDFGAALLGDARYDLGKILWRDFSGIDSGPSMTFLRNWETAMNTELSLDVVKLYTLAHCIAALAWLVATKNKRHEHRDFEERAVLSFTELVKDLGGKESHIF